MSRAPYFDNGRLPALKSGYEDPRPSPRELVPVHPVHPVSRIDYLEEKLAAQVSYRFSIRFQLKDNHHFSNGNCIVPVLVLSFCVLVLNRKCL